MLEFVLVLPVFALILFMVLDYGWLFINYIEVSNTSRNAARIACVEYETVNLENGAVVSPKSYTLDDLDDDDIQMILRLRLKTERLKTGQAVMLRFMLNAGYPFLRRF